MREIFWQFKLKVTHREGMLVLEKSEIKYIQALILSSSFPLDQFNTDLSILKQKNKKMKQKIVENSKKQIKGQSPKETITNQNKYINQWK